MINIDESKKISKFKEIHLPALEKLFSIYEIKQNDNILIWCDDAKTVAPRIAKTIYLKLKKMKCTVSIIVDKPTKKLGSATKKTQKAIKSLKKGDAFFSIGSGNRGYVEENGKHVLMKELIKKQRFKMISLGGLYSIKAEKINSFLKSFNHDKKKVHKLNKKIKKILEKTKEIKITCPKGTNLHILLGKRPVICNEGNWKEYSTNYPVGETYTSPIENSVKGIAFVSSAKISGKTILPKKPVKFIFEKGILVSTNSKAINSNLKYVEKFNKRKKINNYKNAVRTIAEFAIGTNSKASLVGAMICDEKALGTCHFATGNNKHLGGKNYCHGHFDYVIVKPSIWFDGKQIMKKGKLII
ncbi:MAG: aminopeptidase [archaeon]